MNPKYEMSIGVSVLQHLGLNLYSNLPSVLTEVVANAWDADATEININIDTHKHIIEITDNGFGMTLEDINHKYLFVGYSKRKDMKITPKFKRKVMGRKGIGKLSLFAIAKNIDVYTTKNNEKHGFRISREEIEKLNNQNTGKYEPRILDISLIDFEKGTKIILSDLTTNIHNITNQLRKRLSKRFSMIGHDENFTIKIDGKAITFDDRKYYDNLQFVWYLGDESLSTTKQKFDGRNVEKLNKLNNIVDDKLNYKVKGWVGTFLNQPKSSSGLVTEGDENILAIYANGRIIQEDMLAVFKDNMFYASYLVGEIEADFLDLNDKDDISTSDRQSLRQDDERFEKLKEYIKTEILKPIRNSWGKLRTEKPQAQAMKNENVKEWYNSLTEGNKDLAQEVMKKVESLIVEPEQKAEIYKTSILAFETLSIKGQSNKIKEVFENLDSQKDFNLLKNLFDDIDQLEAISYYRIIKKRIEIIREFDKIAPSSKEKVVQEYLFNHLWLLHPSWERASENPIMEKAMRTIPEFAGVEAGLTEEQLRGRLDISYRTAAGKHIIIELKKYDKVIEIEDLLKQVRKYRDSFLKLLKTKYPNEHRALEIICILGQSPAPQDEEERNQNLLKEYNARYITYDTLIRESLESYEMYLEISKKNEKLVSILRNLDSDS